MEYLDIYNLFGIILYIIFLGYYFCLDWLISKGNIFLFASFIILYLGFAANFYYFKEFSFDESFIKALFLIPFMAAVLLIKLHNTKNH